MTHTMVKPAISATAIHPFRANVPEEALVDLRHRLTATRWPDKETVADRSQGAHVAALSPRTRTTLALHEAPACVVISVPA